MRLENVISNISSGNRLFSSTKDKVFSKHRENPISGFANLPVPTIFHENWWLETVSQCDYRTTKIYSDGMVVGWMPYILSKKPTGQKYVAMPAMTHVLGPALASDIAAVGNLRSLRRFKIIRDLIDQLPNVSHTQFQLHGDLADTLAFDAAGFTTTAGYTTEILPNSSENLWSQLRDKTRNVIRRAEEQLIVNEINDPLQFTKYYESNLHDRGLHNIYDKRTCEKIIEECLKRRVGRIITASKPNGDVLASIFTIWDNKKEYFYLSSRKIEATNGAISLLIWRAIQHASENGLSFDSDGLNKNNFTLLTGFGGLLRARYTVHRSTKLFRTGKFIRDIIC